MNFPTLLNPTTKENDNFGQLVIVKTPNHQERERRVHHSRIWVYYDFKGDDIRPQIINLINSVCSSCENCFQQEKREQAIQVLVKLLPKLRNIHLINEVFYKEKLQSLPRIEYQLELSNPDTWLKERLWEVNIQKKNIQNFYNKLCLIERKKIAELITNQFQQNEITEEKTDKIINKYIGSQLLNKRSYEELDVEQSVADSLTNMDQKFVEDLYSIEYLHVFKGNISNISYENTGTIFLASKMYKSLYYKNIKQSNESNFQTIPAGMGGNKLVSFITTFNENNQKLGIVEDYRFSIYDWNGKNLSNFQNIIDYHNTFTAVTWLNPTQVVLADKHHIKIANIITKEVESFSLSRSAFNVHALIVKDENKIYFPIKGGFSLLDLNAETKSAQPLCKSTSTIPLHLASHDKFTVFSDKPRGDRPTVWFSPTDQAENALSLNSCIEVLGLNIREKAGQSYIQVLSSKTMQLWDIRNRDKPLNTINLRYPVSCLHTTENECFVGFQESYFATIKENYT